MVYPSNINLNLNTQYVLPIPTAQQGDTARVLTFNILDNGVPFNLQEKTVRAKIIKPDGTKCYNDLTITNATGGECDLKLTNQVLAVAGKVNCQLEIKEGEELLSTIIFNIEVRESIDVTGAVESSNEFTALESGLTKLDEWDKYFKETSGAIEEKYTERLNGIASSLEETKNKVVSLDNSKLEKNVAETTYAKKVELLDKATKTELEIERARINQFTKLQEGSTTGDAELTDIRVGFNGISYSTAGESVREQNNILSKEIKDNALYLKGNFKENIFNKADIIKGYFSSEGVLKPKENFVCYKLKVNEKTNYIITSNDFYVDFIGSGDSFISKEGNGLTQKSFKFTTPINCKYAYININLAVTNIDEYMIVEGVELPQKYVEFGSIQLNEGFGMTPCMKEQLDNTINILCNGSIERKNDYDGKGYFNKYGVLNTETGRYKYVNLRKNEKIKISATVNSNITFIKDGSVLVKFTNIDSKVQIVEYKAEQDEVIGICSLEGNDNFNSFFYEIINEGVNQRLEKIEKGNIYYVGRGKASNHDFDSIIECFNYVKDNTDYKEIHIYSGDYDIYEELGGDAYFDTVVETQNWKDVQPVLTNVKIVTVGKVNMTLEIPSKYDWKIAFLFSVLNLRGNFHIKDLNLYGINCRYCIHDESSDQYPNTTHIYENVNCYKTGKWQSVGCGYSVNSIVKINNCHFEGEDEAYSYHSDGGTTLEINNSVLKTKGTNSLRFSQTNNEKSEIKIRNSYVDKDIMLRPEYNYTGTHICNTKIDLVNSKTNVVTSEEYKYDTIEEKVMSYNTINGTIEDITPSA